MRQPVKIFSILFIFCCCSDALERTYYDNGQLYTVGRKVEGKKEGIWIAFDERGDTLNVTPYSGGKRHGRTRNYSEGVLVGMNTYKNGVMDGEQLSIYPNGNVETRTFFEDGEQSSKVINYFSTGAIKQESIKDGRTVQYFKNGQVEFELTNPYDGVITFYDSLGAMTVKATVIDGKMTDTLYCTDR